MTLLLIGSFRFLSAFLLVYDELFFFSWCSCLDFTIFKFLFNVFLTEFLYHIGSHLLTCWRYQSILSFKFIAFGNQKVTRFNFLFRRMLTIFKCCFLCFDSLFDFVLFGSQSALSPSKSGYILDIVVLLFIFIECFIIVLSTLIFVFINNV